MTYFIGMTFLNEMSYLEMKERLRINEQKNNELIQLKSQDININKQSKQEILKMKYDHIQQIRKQKKQVLQQHFEQKHKKEMILRNEELMKTIELQKQLELSLQQRKEIKQETLKQLQYEERRMNRIRDYNKPVSSLSLSLPLIEKANNTIHHEYLQQEEWNKEIKRKESINSLKYQFHLKNSKKQEIELIEKNVIMNKKISLDKLRNTFQYKKHLVEKGKKQFETTKTILKELNPYAASINQDIHKSSLHYKKTIVK